MNQIDMFRIWFTISTAILTGLGNFSASPISQLLTQTTQNLLVLMNPPAIQSEKDGLKKVGTKTPRLFQISNLKSTTWTTREPVAADFKLTSNDNFLACLFLWRIFSRHLSLPRALTPHTFFYPTLFSVPRFFICPLFLYGTLFSLSRFFLCHTFSHAQYFSPSPFLLPKPILPWT